MKPGERRRLYLEQTAPWIGFAVAAGAVAIAGRSIAAGAEGAGVVGYLAGATVLLAGYITARRAWDRTIDAWFLGGLAAVVVLSALVLVGLELPPSIYE